MKIFGYWTLLVALTVSAVAAYYSIIGLTAIFAAAVIPIVIMGGALEVAKITTAVWLHKFWDDTTWMMKAYLTVATIILMIITSMGIFGFLSKAHIEQTAMATEGVAQITRIEKELERAESEVLRAEQAIAKLENKNDTNDTGLQDKISVEETRITGLYSRLELDIASANKSMDESIAPYESQRADIANTLKLIQQYLGNNQIRKVQALIGANPDGSYGPDTADAVKIFREEQAVLIESALVQINEFRSNTVTEIARLRKNTEASVAQSNVLINRLRDQIGVEVPDDTAERLSRERERIKAAEAARDELFEERYGIEIENRKLEAEVGPVKYIAEMIYGDNAGPDILEKAVRFVIIMLVVVFDPLAIVLVLAGVITIARAKEVVIAESTHAYMDGDEDGMVGDVGEEIVADSIVDDTNLRDIVADDIVGSEHADGDAVATDGETEAVDNTDFEEEEEDISTIDATEDVSVPPRTKLEFVADDVVFNIDVHLDDSDSHPMDSFIASDVEEDDHPDEDEIADSETSDLDDPEIDENHVSEEDPIVEAERKVAEPDIGNHQMIITRTSNT